VEGPDSASSTIIEERPHQNGSAPSVQEERPPAAPPPGKRRMKRSTRVALSVIAILALLAALAFGGAYFFYSSKFVSTDNAQVDGDKIQINAPATGTVSDWQGTQGTTVTPEEVIGRIRVNGPDGPQKPIKAPKYGTIAVNNGVEGQYVQAGTQLATAYDLRGGVYITARVDETDIGDVHLGAPVDIDVDAYSGVPVTGVVTEIQGAAAGQFSLFPESNSTGNFQKVTQVIAVRVALTNTGGVTLVPGMNVTVHIHKTP
jgi:multidrug resistance efflux pump